MNEVYYEKDCGCGEFKFKVIGFELLVDNLVLGKFECEKCKNVLSVPFKPVRK